MIDLKIAIALWAILLIAHLIAVRVMRHRSVRHRRGILAEIQDGYRRGDLVAIAVDPPYTVLRLVAIRRESSSQRPLSFELMGDPKKPVDERHEERLVGVAYLPMAHVEALAGYQEEDR